MTFVSSLACASWAAPPSNAIALPKVSAAPAAANDRLSLSPLALFAAELAREGFEHSLLDQLSDAFFALHQRDPERLWTLLEAAGTEEGRALLRQLAELLRQGIIGWELREDVRTKQAVKVFLATGFGTDGWRGLRPLRSGWPVQPDGF